MNFSPFFSVFLGIFLVVWTCSNLFSPAGEATALSDSREVTVISSQPAADGLDLQLLPAIVKESKDATSFEAKLNQADGINNLDLDDDGKVDYLKVEEFGDRNQGSYGFSITTEVKAGEVQEVATVELKQENDQVKVSTHGNQQIYGPGYGYSAFYGVSSFLMWSYLLTPHRFYSSPHYYGNYPSSYRSHPTASRNDYLNRSSRFERKGGSSSSAPSMKSPNYNKAAKQGIKRDLRNPTTSQKSFQSTLKNRSVASGGFGRKSQVSRKGFGSGFFGSGRSVRNFSSSRRSFGGFGK